MCRSLVSIRQARATRANMEAQRTKVLGFKQRTIITLAADNVNQEAWVQSVSAYAREHNCLRYTNRRCNGSRKLNQEDLSEHGKIGKPAGKQAEQITVKKEADAEEEQAHGGLLTLVAYCL